MKNKNIQNIKIVTLALILALGISYASAAWTPAPPPGPPQNNTDAPINVGGSSQTKIGPFNISTTSLTALTVYDGGTVLGYLVTGSRGIYSTGKIGVGISNPEMSIEASLPSSATFNMPSIGTSLANGTKWIYMSPNNADIIRSKNPLHFGVSDTKGAGLSRQMTIDTDGNVGIGTITPTAKLEVAGVVKITGGLPGAGKVLTSDATGLASWAAPSSVPGSGGSSKWATSTVNTANIHNGNLSGNVGIGTNDPTTKLDVLGQGTFGSAGSRVLIGNGAEGFYGDSQNLAIRMKNRADSDIYFQTYNAAASNMIIKNNGPIYTGYWGINFGGTVGDLNYGIGARVSSSLVYDTVLSGNHIFNVGGQEKLRINGSGNVGIGTTNPSSLLHLFTGNADGIRISRNTINVASGDYEQLLFTSRPNDYGTAIRSITTAASGGYLNPRMAFLTQNTGTSDISTGMTEKMTILSSGNVGIGTTTPTTRLEVVGSVKATGLTIPTGAGEGKVLTSDVNGVASWKESKIGNFINLKAHAQNNNSALEVVGVLEPGTYTYSGIITTVNDGGGGFSGLYMGSSGIPNITSINSSLTSLYGPIYGPTNNGINYGTASGVIAIVKRNGANDGTFTVSDRQFTITQRMYIYLITQQNEISGYVYIR
jgi:hypothetical protein